MADEHAEEMGYFVDRVVVCDAYEEPNQHYRILQGGRSKLQEGRRPSMRLLASAREVKGGLAGVVGRQDALFEDMLAEYEQLNDFVNELRGEVRAWRQSGYPGTAIVTGRVLEWWFERDEERKAEGKRLFFCQQEAIETLIYLYEVKSRYRMPETGDLLRYALKLATGTGKTVVMAALVVWSTLHKRKVSGSSLSSNFLVLVPNLTVRDRVSGQPRGDGLDPAGAENLYDAFDMVPPEYRDEFHPKVMVRNWQSIPMGTQRDDWIGEEVAEEGRFVSASVLWAMQRRRRQDPNAAMRRLLGGWRDLIVLNDEAHHVYGEKKGRRGEDPEYIRWNKILDRISKAAKVGLVVDLSATPWYGSGSPKPEGTLFEWLVSDFSVYDAFESGLVKIVRLPDPNKEGVRLINFWDDIKGAKTEAEYLGGCRNAIELLYASWHEDYSDWLGRLEFARGPQPVMLVVTNDGTRAAWLFHHLTSHFDKLRNPDDEDCRNWVTIQIDSKVFDAVKGNEAILREMVSTVGKRGMPGEHVRCIVSVNMLSEGWDVKSVTHILGLRAFGSPLLTEQVIGRGLRLTDYDILKQPYAERPPHSEETVDALGIPFVGFPVERRKKGGGGGHWGENRVYIEPDGKKSDYAISVPNVRTWGVGVSEPLMDVIDVGGLHSISIDSRQTPPLVPMKPVVGQQPDDTLDIDPWREENPVMRTVFGIAEELLSRMSPEDGPVPGVGPTFDELLEVVDSYVGQRVDAIGDSDRRDLGVPRWRNQAVDTLDNAIRSAGLPGLKAIPVLGDPNFLDTTNLRRFLWTGCKAKGKKCHTNWVPCHNPLESDFADFLDGSKDVVKYFKNERFGFSITYYEGGRPRQYFPDFIVVVRDRKGSEVQWIAETKGEIRPNTKLKKDAADFWCEKMNTTSHGVWAHLFVPQGDFEKAIATGVKTFAEMVASLEGTELRLDRVGTPDGLPENP